jgi:hypothetical protein
VLGVENEESLLLPPNATHTLVEVVKESGTKPLFGELNQDLQLSSRQSTRIAWLQPPLGLPIAGNVDAEFTVLDHSDSVPQRVMATNQSSFRADVTIFGLHLSSDPKTAGSLLVFNSETLYSRFMAKHKQVEPMACAQAARQLNRLQTLTCHQTRAVEMVSTGLQLAAGLPTLSVSEGVALAHGVAVRIPDEGLPSTFWTYARNENTPVQWLPQLRPIHYTAIASDSATAKHLERWFIVPVSPHSDEETNKQAVLGIVKTAEYLGLRWWNDPERASQYADLLNTMYGSGHDAYRPAFAIDAQLPAEAIFQAEEVVGPSCRI